MKRKLSWVLLFSAAIVVTGLYYAGNVWATPAQGFVGTTLAKGRFGEIDVYSQSVVPNSHDVQQQANVWLSLQKTKGASDLYVQSNVWQPGGSTGWHMHPG